MGVSRIDIREDNGTRTLIDISNSTIAKDNMLEGAVGYGADGELIEGTIETFDGNYECSGDSTGGGSGSSEDFDKFIEGEPFTVTGNATKVCERAFYENQNVNSIDLPNVRVIGTSAFLGCSKLKRMNLPLVTEIESYAFQSSGLESINAPNLLTIGDNAFSRNNSLLEVILNSVERFIGQCFENCNNLKKVVFQNVSIIPQSCFEACTSLEIADFATVDEIGPNVFHDCLEFKALVLRRELLATIDVSSVVGTKIVDNQGAPTGLGFIYVPTSLYEDYISSLCNRILDFARVNGVPMDIPTATYIATMILRKIEDYTVDGTLTGELDESRI